MAVAELKRPARASASAATSSDGADGGGRNPAEEGSGSGGGGDAASQHHGPGISVQSVPCRNMSNQILYLSVEAASVRVRTGSSLGVGARLHTKRIGVLSSGASEPRFLRFGAVCLGGSKDVGREPIGTREGGFGFQD